MRQIIGTFGTLMLSLFVTVSAHAATTPATPLIPEVRTTLAPDRAVWILILSTDTMFVRHYAAVRQRNLQELDINISLQPWNQKIKVYGETKRKEMEECKKSAEVIQRNFVSAYEQLDAAKYDLSNYIKQMAYEKKYLQVYMDKDILSQADLDKWHGMRPKGFEFRSVCMENGKEYVPNFVSPNDTINRHQ